MVFYEIIETETGDEDENPGLVLPYRFELYANEEDKEDGTKHNRIREIIDSLQNVEW